MKNWFCYFPPLVCQMSQICLMSCCQWGIQCHKCNFSMHVTFKQIIVQSTWMVATTVSSGFAHFLFHLQGKKEGFYFCWEFSSTVQSRQHKDTHLSEAWKANHCKQLSMFGDYSLTLWQNRLVLCEVSMCGLELTANILLL